MRGVPDRQALNPVVVPIFCSDVERRQISFASGRDPKPSVPPLANRAAHDADLHPPTRLRPKNRLEENFLSCRRRHKPDGPRSGSGDANGDGRAPRPRDRSGNSLSASRWRCVLTGLGWTQGWGEKKRSVSSRGAQMASPPKGSHSVVCLPPSAVPFPPSNRNSLDSTTSAADVSTVQVRHLRRCALIPQPSQKRERRRPPWHADDYPRRR